MRLKDKGVALIMTLWVLVLLTVIAMSFSFSTRRSSASTRNLKQDTQAYFLAVSAYEEALAYLLTDPEPLLDYTDEEGRLRTDSVRPPLSGARTLEDAEVEIRLTDEESRLNLNRLNAQSLKRLFEYAGVPDDEIQGLVDSIADWKDPDDLHHLSGAEDEYYESLGYRPKNLFFDTPEELLLVKGFKREYLYGGGEGAERRLYKPIRPMLTVYGHGPNVYTASHENMRVLGLSETEISAAMAARQAAGPGGKPVAFSGGRRGRTFSSFFRIQTVARVSNNPLAVRITAVVRRIFRAGDTEVKTLYWKEDLEPAARSTRDEKETRAL